MLLPIFGAIFILFLSLTQSLAYRMTISKSCRFKFVMIDAIICMLFIVGVTVIAKYTLFEIMGDSPIAGLTFLALVICAPPLLLMILHSKVSRLGSLSIHDL